MLTECFCGVDFMKSKFFLRCVMFWIQKFWQWLSVWEGVFERRSLSGIRPVHKNCMFLSWDWDENCPSVVKSVMAGRKVILSLTFRTYLCRFMKCLLFGRRFYLSALKLGILWTKVPPPPPKKNTVHKDKTCSPLLN